MRFFILGDSWGVGEWKVEDNVFVPVPNTGVNYHLTQLGHVVKNISAGSAGNFGQLRHAYWTLKDDSNYDFIIWFHTESMRDIEEVVMNDVHEANIHFPEFTMSSNFDKTLEYMNRQNYQFAQSLFEEYQIPFIIVGGQNSPELFIEEYTFTTHIIHWLQELLNLPFTPIGNTFFSWEKIKRILKHYSISEKEFILNNLENLDRASIINGLATKSPLFPDNAHPSSECHKQLASRILLWCNKNYGKKLGYKN